MLAGADPARIHFVESVRTGGKDRTFSLVSDLPLLREEIGRIGNVVLVIIDPMSAYLGIGKVDGRSATMCAESLLRSRIWPKNYTLP